jgi:ubiquinone/menaquinone biosynthesis C-methylase UbiE
METPSISELENEGLILEQRGDFFLSNRKGPDVIQVEKTRYRRFLDRIYVPGELYLLDQNQVIELSNLRLDLFDSLVDLRFNRSTYEKLLDGIDLSKPVLDFGCGSGTFSHFLKKVGGKEMSPRCLGLDLNPDAVQQARCIVDAAAIHHDSEFPCFDGQFRSAIAGFVMHFNVTDHQLEELARVIEKSGTFTFNYLYPNDDLFVQSLEKRIQSAGFQLTSKGSESIRKKQQMFFEFKRVSPVSLSGIRRKIR